MCTHVYVLNQEDYSLLIIQRRKEKEIIPMYGRILQGGKTPADCMGCTKKVVNPNRESPGIIF